MPQVSCDTFFITNLTGGVKCLSLSFAIIFIAVDQATTSFLLLLLNFSYFLCRQSDNEKSSKHLLIFE